jgi:hypothetical protein
LTGVKIAIHEEKWAGGAEGDPPSPRLGRDKKQGSILMPRWRDYAALPGISRYRLMGKSPWEGNDWHGNEEKTTKSPRIGVLIDEALKCLTLGGACALFGFGKSMKKSNLFKLVLVACGAGLVTAGCVVQARAPSVEVGVAAPVPEVYVDSAPPPLIVETPPPIPGPGVVWVGGGWVWEGGRWNWNRGYWGHPPHPGMHWVAHHYEFRGGRHVFVRGGWR